MHIGEIEKKKLIEEPKSILVKDKKVLFAYLHGSFFDEEEFNDIDIDIDIVLYLDKKV